MECSEKTRDMIFIHTAGFSMWPFLKSGEKLIIKKTLAKDLKIGDIILYRAEHQLICHRLIKKLNTKSGHVLYVRGDASTGPVQAITGKALVGRAAGALRNGRIINFNGTWQRLANRLIASFAPLCIAGVRTGKGWCRPALMLREKNRPCSDCRKASNNG